MSHHPEAEDKSWVATRHRNTTDYEGVAVDATHPLKPLGPGQSRCPFCQQPRTPTNRGTIPAHGVCPKSTGHHGPVTLDEIPPVVPYSIGNTQPIISAVEGQPAVEVGSLCQSCSKWLPGERRLCGRCARERARR